MPPTSLARLTCAMLTLVCSQLAVAQLQSNRPIRLVTSSLLPAQVVSKATPDGHTLLLITGGIAWVLPLFQKVPYDPVKDFVPLSLIASFPTVMAINASVPANSVSEFIQLARSRPSALNYVMTAPGGSAHLAGELFKFMAKVNLTPVPYKTTGTGVADLVSGRVQMFFSAAGPIMPHVKSGRLNALAVSSPKRSPLFPDLPTVADTVSGYALEGFYCLFAPAGTPEDAVRLLNREVVRVLQDDGVRAKFLAAGVEPRASTPDELGALQEADVTKMAALIREAGLKAR
jgi:tripartite-type tricarboxylate transporter receptor subunit TctC